MEEREEKEVGEENEEEEGPFRENHIAWLISYLELYPDSTPEVVRRMRKRIPLHRIVYLS